MRYEKQVRDGQERRSTKAPGPTAQWAAPCAPREGGPGAAHGSAARKGPRAGGTRAPSASGLSARRGHWSSREAEPLGRARHVRGKRRSQVLTDGAGTARAAPEGRARPLQAPRAHGRGPRGSEHAASETLHACQGPGRQRRPRVPPAGAGPPQPVAPRRGPRAGKRHSPGPQSAISPREPVTLATKLNQASLSVFKSVS